MTNVVPYEEKDTLLQNISLTTEVFEKEFKVLNDIFSVFEGMKEFVEEGDKRTQEGKKISNWGSFLSDFYSNYNSTRNMYAKVLRGNSLSEVDYDYLIENMSWLVKKVSSVFRDEKGVPYVVDSLLAGRFYNKMFYVMFTNQMAVEEHLKLDGSNSSKIIEVTGNEYKNNLELLNKLNTDSMEEKEIYTREERERIATMWYRTVDMVSKDITGLLDNILTVKKEIF